MRSAPLVSSFHTSDFSITHFEQLVKEKQHAKHNNTHQHRAHNPR